MKLFNKTTIQVVIMGATGTVLVHCEVQQVLHSSVVSGGVVKTRSLPTDQTSVRL